MVVASKLLELYELNRNYLNATEIPAQHEALRRMAQKVLEIEGELLHQIPPECLMPKNGDADGFVRAEDGDIHVRRTEGPE